jgi:hypothetical protein
MITRNDFTRMMARDLAKHYLKLDEQITRLQEENARFRKALEKYADPERHSMDKDGFLWSGDYFDYDTARAALEGKG